ncbi:alpha-tectorin-like [Engystomops pustulosus]|uniref:alpha-tectorin-like n=1 Tax=Engystomops pustulosus TaxID=76066 RepID=UPI003AFB02E4
MALGRCFFFLQLVGFAYPSATQEDLDRPIDLCPDPYTTFRQKRMCYNNCDNLNSTTEACVKPLFYGCDCIDGYVYQSATSNVCVPVSSCNVICPPHMHFDPCLTSYRPICGKKTLPASVCLPRCVCDPGYILSDTPVPVCIRIINCLKAIPIELPPSKV